MSVAVSTMGQIRKLTSDLIKIGLCDDSNYPRVLKLAQNIEEIDFGSFDISISLKNVPYSVMYDELKAKRAYNIRMIDGALISFQYRFKNNRIIAHRLVFFPSPNLIQFQNEPEIFLDDEIYADICDPRIVSVPIRFDFDSSTAVAKSFEHPISHLTLGQYKNCRIPVSSAISPYYFVSFIVANFYNTTYRKFKNELSVFRNAFEYTLSKEESSHMHVQSPATGSSFGL